MKQPAGTSQGFAFLLVDPSSLGLVESFCPGVIEHVTGDHGQASTSPLLLAEEGFARLLRRLRTILRHGVPRDQVLPLVLHFIKAGTENAFAALVGT
jgi:hypothetical protein